MRMKREKEKKVMKRIVGIQDVHYEKDGRKVQGARFYYEDDNPISGLLGVKCDSVYIGGVSASDYALGEFKAFASEPVRNGVRFVDVIY